MSRKSAESRTVRKSAAEIPPASTVDLDRLRAAMQGRIDTSEIPERGKVNRLRRDEAGNLPPRKSMIREAVTRQMHRRRLTVNRLWQMARAHYSPLSQAEVDAFLKGQRQLELPSIEALLAAMGLRLVSKRGASGGPTDKGPKRGVKKSVR